MADAELKFVGYRVHRVSMSVGEQFNPALILSPVISFHHSINDTGEAVLVDLQIKIKSSQEDVFDMDLHLKGWFEVDSKVSPELMEGFCNVNAPAILYPFARSIVSNYTAQAAIQPILLPTVNFRKFAKTVHAQQS